MSVQLSDFQQFICFLVVSWPIKRGSIVYFVLFFQDTSLLSRAANFSNVDYLIIHGSGDGKAAF